jgi:hypothetical protein
MSGNATLYTHFTPANMMCFNWLPKSVSHLKKKKKKSQLKHGISANIVKNEYKYNKCV